MSDHCSILERERWKSGGNKPERLMTMMRPGNVNMEKLLQVAVVTSVTTASPHPILCLCLPAQHWVTSRKLGPLADQDNHREHTGTETEEETVDNRYACDGDHGDACSCNDGAELRSVSRVIRQLDPVRR